MPPRADAQRTPDLRRFFADLGRNSAALISRDNVVPFTIGAGATGLAAAADADVRDYFASTNRLGSVTRAGEHAGSAPFVFGAVGGIWALSHAWGGDRFVGFSDDLVQTSVLTALLTQGLKYSIRRTRPNGSQSPSMPSGHTSAAFAAATVVDSYLGTAGSVLGYTAAGLVAATRLDGNKHYLSDVAAGAALGYIVGRTVGQERRAATAGFRFHPVISTTTHSITVSLALQPGAYR